MTGRLSVDFLEKNLLSSVDCSLNLNELFQRVADSKLFDDDFLDIKIKFKQKLKQKLKQKKIMKKKLQVCIKYYLKTSNITSIITQELIIKIIKYLPRKYFKQLFCVSHEFYNIMQNNKILYKDYNIQKQ